MVRRMTPAQYNAWVRQENARRKRAVDTHNAEARRVNAHNERVLKDHKRRVDAYNRRVRANNYRLRKSWRSSTPQPAFVTRPTADR